MRIKKVFASLVILTIFLGGCSKRSSEFIVPKSASSAPVEAKSILNWQLGSSGWKNWISTKTIIISIVAATVIAYQFYTNTRIQEKLNESLKKNEAAANRRVINLYADTIDTLEICSNLFVDKNIKREANPINKTHCQILTI